MLETRAWTTCDSIGVKWRYIYYISHLHAPEMYSALICCWLSVLSCFWLTLHNNYNKRGESMEDFRVEYHFQFHTPWWLFAKTHNNFFNNLLPSKQQPVSFLFLLIIHHSCHLVTFSGKKPTLIQSYVHPVCLGIIFFLIRVSDIVSNLNEAGVELVNSFR